MSWRGPPRPAPGRPAAPTPAAAVRVVAAAAHPWPRLLPKVPFRFCLHPAGDRYWMRLEGGVRGLVPASVRAVDAKDNVVEHRTCLPLAAGQGHAVVLQSTQPLTWTVLTVPNEVAAAFVRTGTWAYRFQAMVGTEWLAVELIDSGCRLRAKAS